LTEEEKKNEPKYRTFGIGAEQSETRMFELTKEKLYEMKQLEQNMRDTHSAYVKEYMNSK